MEVQSAGRLHVEDISVGSLSVFVVHRHPIIIVQHFYWTIERSFVVHRHHTVQNFYWTIERLFTGWFDCNDVLLCDNAIIHTGGEAAIVENLLLWEHLVNGVPLRVLVICLPTRSPELNPIELLFHVLARWIQSWQHRMAEQGPNAVVEQASRVLDEMSYQLILSCYVHCGSL
jgi:hypothetical protein